MKIKDQYGLYTVKEQLAVSDERVCCRAADPFLGSDVVLQLIMLPDAFDAQQQQTFEQQLEKLAELDHPALAPIFDIGREENTCFYTTTFFPQGRFSSSQPLPLSEREGLLVIRQLAEGLAYAHSKGFEHGMLAAEEVFADEQGRPVLTNFGITELLESFYGSASDISAPSQTPSLAQKQSSFGLGELFLALVLPQDDQSVSLVDLVVRLKGYREKELMSALLGLSQEGIPSYDELIRSIDMILDPPEEPLPKGSSQAAERDDFDYPLELDEMIQEESVAVPATVENASPPQQLIEVPAPAGEKTDKENILQHEEQLRLYAQLEEAAAAQKQAEQELVATREMFEQCQQQLKKTQIDKNIALEMLDNQPQQRHPAVWLVGGCLVGMAAAGSLVYFLFNVWMVPAQDQVAHKVSVERMPIVAASTTEQKKVRPVTPEPGDAPVTSVTLPEQKKGAEEKAAGVSSQSVQAAIVSVGGAEKGEKAAATKIESLPSDPIPETAAENPQVLQQEQPDAAKTNIQAFLKAWGKAWSDQDISAYFAHYSGDYQPDAAQSRQEWLEERQRRLSGPAWIEIELDFLDFKFLGADMAEVKLLQKYRSDTYGDRTRKLLSLVRENNQWKIWMERSLN